MLPTGTLHTGEHGWGYPYSYPYGLLTPSHFIRLAVSLPPWSMCGVVVLSGKEGTQLGMVVPRKEGRKLLKLQPFRSRRYPLYDTEDIS